MSGVVFPDGLRLERLRRDHPRKQFRSGQTAVDDWLATKALQNQEKRLASTRALVETSGAIAGYYSLTTEQIDFSSLPGAISRGLPRRVLPAALLAWLGVSQARQRQGIGQRLLAQALNDCHDAGQTFPFIALMVDCIDDAAKAFYERFDFQPLPGRSNRLLLSAARLEALVAGA